MDWNQLILKKEDWQRNTFEMIKSDLISAKDNRFVRYDNSKENHLVMVYGKSQVGKTTLILNMIGLRSDYFSEVYETLRAGVPKGNSSTSTAIIYAKSLNNQYGCALTPINTLSSKDIQYYDKEGMISQLKRIRIQAEENKLSSNAILFIYIPRNYFIRDSATDSISILDMPGIESRNHKEYVHVQNLMTKYIPIASVCIITCRSNEIQSLESLILPNGLEWKRMEHRFILVITHAYIDGTIKQYFRTEPSKRDSSFYDYVIGAYVHDIRKILGSKNHTEVYPIDVGDTLTSLCDEEIKRECDKKEIIETKDRVLANLRKSIIGHKGERLKSALMDLDVIIKRYGEDEIQHIDDKIFDLNSKINDSKNSIKRAVNDIKKLSDEDGEQDELLIELNELKDLKNKFLNLDPCISDFMNQTKQYIYNQKLYKSKLKCDYLRDRDKNVLKFMRVHISESVDKYIKKLNNLIGENDIPHVEVANIRNKTDSYILEEEQNIYPEKLFSKKVSIETIEGIILGTGLGNKEWNSSAPHGSGRIMKREIVKNSFTVSAYKAEMKGIYSSCIGKGTLDEAPFAYRRINEIAEVISDTVTINKIIKPVYNFKAGESR